MATVLYLDRCNFRCPFCHNGDLVLDRESEQATIHTILDKVKSRREFIDGVVITGGEPTIHAGLQEILAALKGFDLPVKLDTNGYRPDVLAQIFDGRHIDFVAMDIKTSPAKYSVAAGIPIDTGRILDSIELIKRSGIEHEFRTTCVPNLVEQSDIEEISMIAGSSSTYTLQQFNPDNTLDPAYRTVTPYTKETLIGFLETARQNVARCRLIGI